MGEGVAMLQHLDPSGANLNVSAIQSLFLENVDKSFAAKVTTYLLPRGVNSATVAQAYRAQVLDTFCSYKEMIQDDSSLAEIEEKFASIDAKASNRDKVECRCIP